MRPFRLYLATVAALLTIAFQSPAYAETFEEYVQKLAEHPQAMSILSESEATKAQAKGELGLPDPMIMIGIDNVPISDPAFDRFLPTSKVIGFSQAIPNPVLLGAKSRKLDEVSAKQQLLADYTIERLRYMFISKLAEYENVKTQEDVIHHQLSHYKELENAFKGQLESGRSVYQRFSEIDVERAEAERQLNNLQAQKETIRAEFFRLVDEVPEMEVPEVTAIVWDNNPNTLYPVLVAAKDVDISRKDIKVADAAFLPNFGVNAVYKQREDGQNRSFSGDDWFSVQAQISIPLWAAKNQVPKLRAAKARERSAIFSYDDIAGQWIKQMTALKSASEASARNIKVLQNKDHAMSQKIKAVQRNYEAGTANLDSVLLAKIDRANIQVQLADARQEYISRVAEYNSNIAPSNTNVIAKKMPVQENSK
jgi:cobalt-zinc-cadmium efflux system outer membrane protein